MFCGLDLIRRALRTSSLGSFMMFMTALAIALVLTPSRARGEIYVTFWDTGRVGVYSNSGTTINSSLVTGLSNPTAIGVAGQYLVVMNFGTNAVGEYTLGPAPGTVSNPFPSLISGLSSPRGLAVNGSDVYVTSYTGTNGRVGKFTLGATPGTVSSSPNLIAGLTGGPNGIAITNSAVFVENSVSNTIGEYGLDGSVINASLITGVTGSQSIAAFGNDLFVASYNSGTNTFNVGKYTLGATPGTIASSVPNLITGTGGPMALAVLNNNIYMDSYTGNAVRQYTTAGALVNIALISQSGGTVGLTVTPEPASLLIVGVGMAGMLLRRRRYRVTEHVSVA